MPRNHELMNCGRKTDHSKFLVIAVEYSILLEGFVSSCGPARRCG